MVDRACLDWYCRTIAGVYGLVPGDRVLQFSSIGFDVLIDEVFPTLIAGATVVPRRPGMTDSVSRFLERCDRLDLTVLNIPTAYWHELAALLRGGRRHLPPGIRLVVIGGERALPARLADWYDAPTAGVRLLHAYGPTETTVAATIEELAPTRPAGLPGGEVPIGRPLPGVVAHILDDDLRPVPPGEPGELVVGGVGVSLGYLNAPELTARKFIDGGEAVPGAGRVYRTGDIVRQRPDLSLEYVGRRDQQVQIRGMRVEIGEIESVLSTHPAVHSAVVELRGSDAASYRLAAHVRLAGGTWAVGVHELYGYLSERLPAHMVPTAYALLDDLPMLPNGKIDRQRLARRTRFEPVRGRPLTTPETSAEQAIAELWEQLLGVAPVGADDGFIELGGNSLLGTRLILAMEERFGVDVGWDELLAGASVRELAARVDGP